MGSITKYLIFIIILFLFSCKSNDEKNNVLNKHSYDVINEEVLNIPGKSQISTYVLYNDSIYEEHILKGIALEVYNKNKKKRLVDNELAKFLMVYIYSNKEDYTNDRSKCITMLYKGIDSKQPEITYALPQKMLPEAYPVPASSEKSAVDNNSDETIMESNSQYFSSWDGSNPQFVEAIKNKMNDPESFKHVETRYDDKGANLRIQMKYRGKNGFNAIITETSTCTFNKSTGTVSDIN